MASQLERELQNIEDPRRKQLALYEDDCMIVVNKPAGIKMTRSWFLDRDNLTDQIKEVFGVPEATPAHLLDKDTTGVIVFARTARNRRSLHNQFQKRKVSKRYLALVDGDWNPKVAGMIAPMMGGVISKSENAKVSASAFEPIAQFQDDNGGIRSLLQVRINTGRTHQIRAQVSHLGTPVSGDIAYGSESAYPHFLLHAYQLTIQHPHQHIPMTFTAPLPFLFRNTIDTMQKVWGSAPE